MNITMKMLSGALLMAAASWSGSAQACDDGQDRAVAVINATGVVLRELYGSSVNRSDWGSDVLGAGVIAAGRTVRIDFDDDSCACRLDIKAVFADGDEVVRRNFNVCTETTLRIED